MPHGLHARPCAFLSCLAQRYFPKEGIILVCPKSREEGAITSIIQTMMLCIREGELVEFISDMKPDRWAAWERIVTNLFFDPRDRENPYERSDKIYGLRHELDVDDFARCLVLAEGERSDYQKSFVKVAALPAVAPPDRRNLTDLVANLFPRRPEPETPAALDAPRLSAQESPAKVPAAGTAGAPSPPIRHQVFISKASADAAYAAQAYRYLTAHGFSCFLSEISLPELRTTDYQDAIERALEDCEHMVVITSAPGNVNSDWVKMEWRTFLNEKRSGRKSGNLLTLLVGEMTIDQLPIALRAFQVERYSDECFDRLVKYLICVR